jgi:hypothetical protein
MCTQGSGAKKRSFLRLMRRYDNIKMQLQLVECVAMDWTDLAQDREGRRVLVNAVTNLQVP